jgi:hypothetical protein
MPNLHDIPRPDTAASASHGASASPRLSESTLLGNGQTMLSFSHHMNILYLACLMSGIALGIAACSFFVVWQDHAALLNISKRVDFLDLVTREQDLVDTKTGDLLTAIQRQLELLQTNHVASRTNQLLLQRQQAQVLALLAVMAQELEIGPLTLENVPLPEVEP